MKNILKEKKYKFELVIHTAKHGFEVLNVPKCKISGNLVFETQLKRVEK